MIKLEVPKKFGSRIYKFVVEADNLFGVLKESEKLSFHSIAKCELCGSDNLRLNAYTAQYEKNGKKQQADYIKVVCNNCKGGVTLGRRMDDPDTYFLRKNESGGLDWQAYKGKAGAPAAKPSEEVPF